MCEIDKEIKFCTCANQPQKIIHNKNSRRYKKETLSNFETITWILYQYEGEFYSGMEGILMQPHHQLDDILTDEYIKNKLNEKQCFDFEYQPNEGDCLIISCNKPNFQSYFLSFIYKNNQWTINTYNTFEAILVKLNKGIVQINSNKTL